MSEHPGLGVMLRWLGGNASSVAAYQAAQGKEISLVELVDDALRLRFSDGTGVRFHDEGQSCCEHRYMRTDDDLSEFVGAKFLEAELRDAPNEPDEYGEHEVQFLAIKTDRGAFVMSSHNEHNGYYGGFAIEVIAE